MLSNSHFWIPPTNVRSPPTEFSEFSPTGEGLFPPPAHVEWETLY